MKRGDLVRQAKDSYSVEDSINEFNGVTPHRAVVCSERVVDMTSVCILSRVMFFVDAVYPEDAKMRC